MSKLNKWTPREPLELGSWNPLPKVNIARRTAVAVHSAWASVALVSVFVHGVARPDQAVLYGVLWFSGHLSLQYFIQRMRGNRANMPGPASVDNHETPLQMRVLGDLIVLGWLLISVAVTVLGLPLITEFRKGVSR